MWAAVGGCPPILNLAFLRGPRPPRSRQATTLPRQEGIMTVMRMTALVTVIGLSSVGARAEDKKPPAAAPAAAPAAPAAAPAAPAAAPAAAAVAMTPPKPTPEWEAFTKGIEGTWKCESTSPAGAMGPG